MCCTRMMPAPWALTRSRRCPESDAGGSGGEDWCPGQESVRAEPTGQRRSYVRRAARRTGPTLADEAPWRWIPCKRPNSAGAAGSPGVVVVILPPVPPELTDPPSRRSRQHRRTGHRRHSARRAAALASSCRRGGHTTALPSRAAPVVVPRSAGRAATVWAACLPVVPPRAGRTTALPRCRPRAPPARPCCRLLSVVHPRAVPPFSLAPPRLSAPLPDVLRRLSPSCSGRCCGKRPYRP